MSADGNEQPVIRVRGLVNRFGGQTVHDGLDLDVNPGEILGVVGGSGTGKSVLMRSIIGLQTPDAGEVHVFGESMIGRLDDEALAIRKRTGRACTGQEHAQAAAAVDAALHCLTSHGHLA